MRRRVLATASLALLLGACSTQALPPSPPPPTLGVKVGAVETYFESQGGGHWTVGRLTGGKVGFAAGNAQGQYCPMLINGAPEVSEILITCRLNGPLSSTPQEATAVAQSAIDHFVPEASAWATQHLSDEFASQAPSSFAKTTSGDKTVKIVRTPADLTLSIQAT